MTKLEIKKLDSAKIAAIQRFLRTFIPQIPAIIAYVIGVKPEWAITLTAVGALITAIDKFLRDMKFY